MLHPASVDTSGDRLPKPGSTSLVDSAFELAGLWALAILQPLLELIGGDAPFLLHHRSDTVDLALALTVIALGPPTMLWLAGVLAGRLGGAAARQSTHRAVLASLVVLLLLGTLRKLGDPLPTWALLPVVVTLLWLVPVALRRWSVLASLLRVCALALPVVVVLFWISPGAHAARATAGAEAQSALPDSPTGEQLPRPDSSPVVWVVFDELPLLSIIDADLGIDRHLCPNLAAFADSATWYRNATTAWSSTSESLVSILTGRIGEPRAPPTRDSYPGNLFTWLAPSHEARAFESVTSMAPASAIELLPRPRRSTRLYGLLVDSSIVTAHLVAPPELATALPPIDTRWGGFWSSRVVRGRPTEDAAPVPRTPWAFALADARASQFATFLRSIVASEPPGLFFAHIMLPHMPFRYLPSGRVYGGRPVYERPATAWLENDWFALETYQRHLLQVGYVDRLVGDLRTRLEETGLWDRAVVVLTSDHGASYWPGQDRRVPLGTEHPDDILRVPLFIKAPFQAEGRIDDRPAMTMDAVPTVAALLDRSLDWPTDGVNLEREREIPTEIVLRDPRGDEMSFGATFAPDRESLARKLELFDPHAGPWRWARLGLYRNLVGTRVDAIFVAPAHSDCRAEVDQLPVLEKHDPSSLYSPAFHTGALECARDLPPAPYIAVAVNGVVAGTAAMQQVAGEQGLYAIMTAEAALRAGQNEIDLLLVSGPPAEPLIERVRITRRRDG